jgi:hypothetical protein
MNNMNSFITNNTDQPYLLFFEGMLVNFRFF